MTDVLPLVLIVEDEAPMRRFLRAALVARDFRVAEAATAREGIVAVTAHRPDIVLLDLGLPDADGIDVTRELREWSQVPVIVLSARGREEDKVAALDAGADDYVTKPFGVDELLARMRVALRRTARIEGRETTTVLETGALRVDLEKREVTSEGRPVRLTPIEFRLLVCLARHPGRVLTHGQLVKEVWSGAAGVAAHHVRVHMAELRKKIEDDPARPKILITEPGVGYRLKE
jgi:two-component system, OmpR family, KDP operon response regulator KdpE